MAGSCSPTPSASSSTAPPRTMLLELKRRLRHAKAARQHPTPGRAFDVLSEGRCLYSGITKCSGPPLHVGFRGWDDDTNTLCCKAHIGRLRKLDGRQLDELESYLREAFAWRRTSSERPIS